MIPSGLYQIALETPVWVVLVSSGDVPERVSKWAIECLKHVPIELVCWGGGGVRGSCSTRHLRRAKRSALNAVLGEGGSRSVHAAGLAEALALGVGRGVAQFGAGIVGERVQACDDLGVLAGEVL